MPFQTPLERRLVLASHNEGKLREIRALMEPFGFEITSAAEEGLDEPIEDGATFEENAHKKAHFAACETGLTALSDDSGMCVQALDGAPGVHTADWAEKPDGSGRDFSLAMERLENELQARKAATAEDRRAFFCAVLCLCRPNGEAQYFRGEAHGTLIWPPRGELGFGYDPVFVPDGHERTFGEMTSEQKHNWRQGAGEPLSHRARAFALFAERHLTDRPPA